MGYPWDKLCPTVVFAICKWVLVSKKKFPIESEWNIEIWSECAKQGQHFNNWPLNCKLIVTTASPMSASINGFKKLLTATRAASPIASIRRVLCPNENAGAIGDSLTQPSAAGILNHFHKSPSGGQLWHRKMALSEATLKSSIPRGCSLPNRVNGF